MGDELPLAMAWEELSGRQQAAAELLGYEEGDFEG